jgi:hypothetical protein
MLRAVGAHDLCAYDQMFWLLFLFFVPNFLSLSLRRETYNFEAPAERLRGHNACLSSPSFGGNAKRVFQTTA